LDGRKTQVYRIKKAEVFMGLRLTEGETAKLWVDAKTGLPVRIAVGDPSDKDKRFIVFEQFAWNEALDPDLFSLEVPKGFPR
jgi:outer membrane lipoprotein-sorting protein